MPRPILFLDISRLVRRFEHFGGPTGVDRIEAAYLRWLLSQSAFEPRTVTRHGRRLVELPRRAAQRVLRTVETRWAEPVPPGFAVPARVSPRFMLERVHHRTLRLALLRAARTPSADGRPSVYLNVGQDGLDVAERMASLPGAKAVLIHDIIPITHPEYDTQRLTKLHARRIASVVALADHVFTNSEATRSALLAHVGPARFTSSVALLAPALRKPQAASRYDRPTFVHLSSINRRKNLAMLLHVWREIASLEDSPDLVVLGRRGNDASALALVDHAPQLAGRVRVMGALNDDDVAHHLAGARALLTPSFAEGFGLPIVEAHAMGVPVVASDIPAHREVGGPATTYLSPLDGIGWRDRILALTRDDALHRSAVAAIPTPPTWQDHFAGVTDRLLSLAR